MKRRTTHFSREIMEIMHFFKWCLFGANLNLIENPYKMSLSSYFKVMAL